MELICFSVGWSAYTDEFQRLVKGISQSLKVITVWHDQELIGIIRSVGEEKLLVRQKVLLTQGRTKQFYEQFDFVSIDCHKTVCCYKEY
ncbi:hypothetical protein AALA44_01660 [Enterococcus ratti]|uniref:hypothetical protein n=1 Tax=Enterococcus ratti TaxID=150033 RepID=UPI003515D81C